MKIYVGNLPWSVRDSELRNLFAPHGEVRSASVVMDRETGRSRGFGFVEMSNSEGPKAISELNDSEVQGRRLRVSQARERQPGPGRSGPPINRQ